MEKVKTVKIEWPKDAPETWVYVGAGEDREEISRRLKERIEKELGDEGFVTEQDSQGMPITIMKIIHWTEDIRKLEAINEIVRKF